MIKPEGKNVRIENESVRIRDFTKDDLPVMLKWLLNRGWPLKSIA